MIAFKVGASGPEGMGMPALSCPSCGAAAESQGRLDEDPLVEIVACPACGEYWVRPWTIVNEAPNEN